MNEKLKPESQLAILIVEDDCDASDILVQIITSRFPHIITDLATSGEEGLARFRQQRYQIVVTDIRMPGMDGIRMAEEIKTINPDVALIFMTGYHEQYDLTRLKALGIHECIMKPVDLKKLLRAIEACIAQIQQ